MVLLYCSPLEAVFQFRKLFFNIGLNDFSGSAKADGSETAPIGTERHRSAPIGTNRHGTAPIGTDRPGSAQNANWPKSYFKKHLGQFLSWRTRKKVFSRKSGSKLLRMLYSVFK
jgi:hypothetical protein